MIKLVTPLKKSTSRKLSLSKIKNIYTTPPPLKLYNPSITININIHIYFQQKGYRVIRGCGSVFVLLDTMKERDVDYQNARPSSFLSAPELRFTL